MLEVSEPKLLLNHSLRLSDSRFAPVWRFGRFEAPDLLSEGTPLNFRSIGPLLHLLPDLPLSLGKPPKSRFG